MRKPAAVIAAAVAVIAGLTCLPAASADRPHAASWSAGDQRTHAVATVAPGSLWPGRKLTVPATYQGRRVLHYQWLRCDQAGRRCSKIRGATRRTYTVRRVDVGHTLRARVVTLTASATTTPTASVGQGRPVNSALPAITDDGAGGGSLTGPVSGDNLGGNAGTWSHALHFTYQWFDCVPSGQTPPAGFVQTATLDSIACEGATGNGTPSAQTTSTAAPAYPLSSADVGFAIVLQVVAYNT